MSIGDDFNVGAIPMGFMEKAGNWLGKAWDSVTSNDDLMAGVAFGTVSGIGNYLASQDSIKADEKRWQAELAQKERFNERKASSASANDNYGSHAANISGGTGLIASYMPIQK